MKEEAMKNYRRLLWALSLLGTLSFIILHSLTPAVESGEESGAVYLALWQFFPFLTHSLVRKLAHFCEYALLGAHLYFLPPLFAKVRWQLVLLFGLPIALFDEGLQSFVPGRSPAITDVLLDFSGYLFGLFFLALCMRIFKAFHRMGASNHV